MELIANKFPGDDSDVRSSSAGSDDDGNIIDFFGVNLAGDVPSKRASYP